MTDLQLFPALDPATEAALRSSIQSHGVIVPAVIDQNGRTIDGHHRRRIASDLGVECPVTVHEVHDEDYARQIAATLNTDRRHLSIEDRRRIVADLRAEGHSTRAIADATGVDHSTVVRDINRGGAPAPPETVKGRDGKTYPTSRPKPGDTITDNDGQPHLIDQVHDLPDENASMVVDTDGEYTVIPNPEDEPAPNPVRKPDIGAGEGISHPARYSTGMLDVFGDLIDRYQRNHLGGIEGLPFLLDPFAGVGTIHELDKISALTFGIEIEPEWADLHPQTTLGSALELPSENEFFDIVCTSPTYGNRLADSHNATDPERRRSYTHDLGRKLNDNNSGHMQWGPEYILFHEEAWAETDRVLTPGGIVILNIKDHIRDGNRQAVSAWHARHFTYDLGYELVDCVPFTGRNLALGDNRASRVDAELIWVFRKPEVHQ